MKNKTTEKNIVKYLTHFVEDYPMVRFDYEFDNTQNTFVISYELPNTIGDNDTLWDALYELEKKMNDDYTLGIPLFTEKNRLFTLSSKAKTIKSNPENVVVDTRDGEYASKKSKRVALRNVIPAWVRHKSEKIHPLQG